jgi:hypothetical protein
LPTEGRSDLEKASWWWSLMMVSTVTIELCLSYFSEGQLLIITTWHIRLRLRLVVGVLL